MEISNKERDYEVDIDINYLTNDFDENLVDEQQDENADSFGSEIIFE